MPGQDEIRGRHRGGHRLSISGTLETSDPHY
jgi:hypothetical protein